MDVAEYKQKLQEYENEISAFSNKIEDAQKNLIVAQTKIESYENEIAKIEEQCIQKFGVPAKDLGTLIEKNMNELDKIVMQVREAQNNNPKDEQAI